METLDLEAWWPELFDGLSQQERRSIVQAFAANWHEGWEPNFDDVNDMCEYSKGLIDYDEYMTRAYDRARQLSGVPVAA